MKRTSYIVHRTSYIIILLALLLAGCHDNDEPPVYPIPEPRAEAERTVIVYIAADNTLNYAVHTDTTEMVAGKNQIPENVNFILYVDTRTHKPAIYEISAGKGLKLWKQYEEEHCSTDRSVMLNVLREIEHYFPARHYGITYWSHATGWPPRYNARQKTFGKDENPGATTSGEIEMEIPVLRDVLAQLPHFDYIFFDACFMQCIEVAYELRNVTDYMIGSPAEIPAPGAPYDKIVGALCSGDVEGIARGYDNGYPGTYDGYYYPGVLLSCIDCSKLDALAEATGGLLTPLYMEHSEPSTDGFQFYCNFHLEKFTYYFDMRTTMCRLLSSEDYAAWMEVFDQAVPLRTLPPTGIWYANYCIPSSASKVQDPDCYGGVSMFVPMGIYDESSHWNEDFHNTSWYTATGWDKTGW